NSCPTGIATQRSELRAKFRGTPEQVVAYFTWIAEDVRRILADLGARTLDEIIGRVELLERVDRPEVPRAQMLDLSVLLTPPPLRPPPAPPPPGESRRRTVERNDRPGVESLDEEILRVLGPRLESGRPFAGVYDIGNHHLTVGARIAGRIAQRHGGTGLPEGSVRLRFRGIEGAGHHCCEDMTAGVVLVLGAVGRNFAAGMSNGVAYVLDETETFSARCNFDMVRVQPLAETDERAVLELARQHLAKTGSPRAHEVVGAWERYRALFRK